VLTRILIALAVVSTLAGCQESGFDESRETQRPLKVQHALDKLTGTKVPGLAERPVTLTADTLGDALALGVEPAAAALDGGMPPYLASAAHGIRIIKSSDLTAISAATPDVILGSKGPNGLQYDDLRKIAPTVIGKGVNWKLNLRLHGEALGRTNDAEELLIDWDNRVARVKEAIGGRRISVAVTAERDIREVGLDPDTFAGSILGDLGMEPGSGGEEVLRVRAGREWIGGGVLAARAVLADIEREL
jgi:iron complex transport system substrate-binding protein